MSVKSGRKAGDQVIEALSVASQRADLVRMQAGLMNGLVHVESPRTTVPVSPVAIVEMWKSASDRGLAGGLHGGADLIEFRPTIRRRRRERGAIYAACGVRAHWLDHGR